MTDSQLKCRHVSHNNQDIIAVCTKINCNKSRLCCFDCLMKDRIHNEHNEQIIQLTHFNEWKQSEGKIIEQIKQLINSQDNLSYLLKQIIMENEKAININIGFATSTEIEESINLINQVKNISTVLQKDTDQLNQQINKIIKELKQFKSQQISQQHFKKQQIAQVKQQIIHESIQKIQFRFSEQGKSEQIDVSNQGRVANARYPGAFCLCEPVLPRNVKTKFAIKFIGGTVCIGISKRDIIRKAFFNTGHGSYLIDNNGHSYSHHQQEMNNKKQSFKFSPDDIITVKVDLIQQKITWINQQTKQTLTIELDKEEQDYYPCVYLFAGKVSIIDNF